MAPPPPCAFASPLPSSLSRTRVGLCYTAAMERIEAVPLFPLNVVLFPGMSMPLHIFEPRYRTMIARCLAEQIEFGVGLIREGVEAGGPAVPFDVGTMARIVQSEEQEDGRYQIAIVGTRRFRILNLSGDQPYLTGNIQLIEADYGAEGPEGDTVRQLADTVTALFAEYYRLTLALAEQWQERIGLPGDPAALVDFVGSRLAAPAGIKQRLLEAPTVAAALELERDVLGQAIPMLSASVKQRQQRRWGAPEILN